MGSYQIFKQNYITKKFEVIEGCVNYDVKSKKDLSDWHLPET